MEEKLLMNIYTYSLIVKKYRYKTHHFGIIYAESNEEFSYKFYSYAIEIYDFTIELICYINKLNDYHKILNSSILNSISVELSELLQERFDIIGTRLDEKLNDEDLDSIVDAYIDDYLDPGIILDLFKNNEIPVKILSDFIFSTDICNLSINKFNEI